MRTRRANIAASARESNTQWLELSESYGAIYRSMYNSRFFVDDLSGVELVNGYRSPFDYESEVSYWSHMAGPKDNGYVHFPTNSLGTTLGALSVPTTESYSIEYMFRTPHSVDAEVNMIIHPDGDLSVIRYGDLLLTLGITTEEGYLNYYTISDIDDNQWRHIVYIKERDYIAIFLDGVLLDEFSFTQKPFPSFVSALIGYTYALRNNTSFDLCNIGVYLDRLTPTQVRRLFQAQQQQLEVQFTETFFVDITIAPSGRQYVNMRDMINSLNGHDANNISNIIEAEMTIGVVENMPSGQADLMCQIGSLPISSINAVDSGMWHPIDINGGAQLTHTTQPATVELKNPESEQGMLVEDGYQTIKYIHTGSTVFDTYANCMVGAFAFACTAHIPAITLTWTERIDDA